ncbi:MAG: hypothetical protein QHH09_00200 [Microgenomates group bacterium]|nr:hypothetical protein [Microgenomates group bacterium]
MNQSQFPLPVKPSQSVTSQIPPSYEKSSSDSKKLLLIVGLILLLLIIIAVAIYIGIKIGEKINQNQSQTPPATQNLTFPTKNLIAPTEIKTSPIATPTTDPTAGWKTYTYKNYFSLKIPSNWEIQPDEHNDIYVSIFNPKKMYIDITNGGGKITLPKEFFTVWSVWATNQTTKQVADEFENEWNETWGSKLDFHRESANINGLEVELLDNQGPEARGRMIIITNGKFAIKLESSIKSIRDNNIENQILSTFKFL